MEDESSKHCPDSKDEVACQGSSFWVPLKSLSDIGNSEPKITRVDMRIENMSYMDIKDIMANKRIIW